MVEKKPKQKKKIGIRTKKTTDIAEKTTANTAPAVWNPFDIMDAMDRWFWEDPWTPIWRRHRSSLIPRETMFDRMMMDTDTKITNIDMIDTGTEYKITAEMPGVSKNDIEVNVTPNNISICGETNIESEEKDQGYIRRERSYSTICRNMVFPEEVNPDHADATLKDGILEITIQKKTPTKGRNIPIK